MLFRSSALTTLQGTNFTAYTDVLYNGINSGISLGGPSVAFIYQDTNSSTASYDGAATTPYVGPANAGSGSWTSGARGGIANSSAGRASVMNNGAVYKNASAFATSMTTVRLGAYASGSQVGNGWYRSLAIYNQRLPDPILKQKSSTGAPY